MRLNRHPKDHKNGGFVVIVRTRAKVFNSRPSEGGRTGNISQIHLSQASC